MASLNNFRSIYQLAKPFCQQNELISCEPHTDLGRAAVVYHVKLKGFVNLCSSTPNQLYMHVLAKIKTLYLKNVRSSIVQSQHMGISNAASVVRGISFSESWSIIARLEVSQRTGLHIHFNSRKLCHLIKIRISQNAQC